MLRLLGAMTLAVTLLTLSEPSGAAEGDAPLSIVKPAAPAHASYPKIVLYSVAWCPHCKEAKEYFTRNNIAFINRDVELDAAAMTDLTVKYKSQGVPVIVIGDDDKVLKGFDREKFEKAVTEVEKKKEPK